MVSFALADFMSGGCSELGVRLTYREDSNNVSGNLEVCYENKWRTVCLEQLTSDDLRVACRTLGFSANENEFNMEASFLNDSGIPFERDFSCSGMEESLSECYGSEASIVVCTSVRIQCAGIKKHNVGI